MAQARLIIFFAIALCGLTVVALFLSVTKAPTHFVPMILGIPTLFCGVVALNPHRRARSAQFVGLLAAIGVLMAGGRLSILVTRIASGVDTSRLSLWLIVVMSVVCTALLGVCIWSIRSCVRSRGGFVPKTDCDDPRMVSSVPGPDLTVGPSADLSEDEPTKNSTMKNSSGIDSGEIGTVKLSSPVADPVNGLASTTEAGTIEAGTAGPSRLLP